MTHRQAVSVWAALVAAACSRGVDPPPITDAVRIVGGAFQMGAHPDEGTPGVCAMDEQKSCFDDRQAGRCVVMPSFLLDRHEVTNDQYRHCVERGGCSRQEFSNAGSHDDYRDALEFDDHPTVSVTWFQAHQYCAWVGKRLPTEAEWEFAARGPAGRRFPWGSEEGPAADCTVNLNECSVTTHGDIEGSPVSVMSGQYDRDSTPDLVRDMAGNVREWTSDIYEATAYCDAADASVFDGCGRDQGCMRAQCRSPEGVEAGCRLSCAGDNDYFCHAAPFNAVFVAPKGPAGNVTAESMMVSRGSSYEARSLCRAEAADRSSFRAGSSHVQVGFRCAQDLASGGRTCLSDADCASGACDGGRCDGEALPTSCADL